MSLLHARKQDKILIKNTSNLWRTPGVGSFEFCNYLICRNYPSINLLKKLHLIGYRLDSESPIKLIF